MTLTATLYSKPGCHLCDDALATMARLRPHYPHTLNVIDITSDAYLLRAYGERIPVLAIGDREYDAPLAAAVIERALQHAEPSNWPRRGGPA